jgi:glyoxylase-like metal-dependent hydrolase (beta-lactamase superfamily II)
LEIGNYDCRTIETGSLHLQGKEMFCGAPGAAWLREFPPDAQGRVIVAVRSLLLRGAGATVVVDAGCGAALPVALAREYDVDPGAPALPVLLAGLGLRPEEVTHLVLTHLHFDHAGGAVRRDGEGAFRLLFPRALHLVQRRQLEEAENPGPREAGAYMAGVAAALRASVMLRVLDGPVEILPGVSLRPAHGHTPGQQVLLVASGGQSLLFPADVIPTAAHLRSPWLTAFDLDPRLAQAEKKALVAEAAEKGWVVVYDHDPRLAASTVARAGRGFTTGRTWDRL